MKSARVVAGGVGAAVLLVFILAFRVPISRGLDSVRGSFTGIFGRTASEEMLRALERENLELRAALELYASRGTADPAEGALRAHVYSRYPFEEGGKLIVDVGREDGVEVGMSVLLNQRTLLGKVAAVRRSLSEVETIFSPAWKSSVGVGSAKALLTGGNAPQLSLIPRNAIFATSAAVTNIDPAYPYGLLVGTVGAHLGSGGDLWVTHAIEVPYRENAIQEVLIVTRFP